MILTEDEREIVKPGVAREHNSVHKLKAARNEIGQLIEEAELKSLEETNGDQREECFQVSVALVQAKAAKVRCDASHDCSLQRLSSGTEGVPLCLLLTHD